ncbi:MAG: zinc ribbon domain-containing protein [Candidatus Lokiarchaeota archaeon]|nr:zinc ribbon domain-containing protein [Candidatus Lokiarchaeota archaeon]
MPRNNSNIGSIVGLIIFLGIGVFFLFGSSPFFLFNFTPFFPMIIIIIVIVIAGVTSASRRRSTSYSPKSHNHYPYYTTEVPRSNPYIAKPSSSSVVRPIYIEDSEPEKPMANFCQYCGTKKDINALYCHNCGIKLQ